MCPSHPDLPGTHGLMGLTENSGGDRRHRSCPRAVAGHPEGGQASPHITLGCHVLPLGKAGWGLEREGGGRTVAFPHHAPQHAGDFRQLRAPAQACS